jgi:predicted nucleic acid-binding protein
MIFLDSSVLYPVFFAQHQHHAPSSKLFHSCTPQTASCAAHSLAELYSTLTRIPPPFRASPRQALECILEIPLRLSLVSLNPEDYLACLKQSSVLAVAGGTIYDALIAACATKSRASKIYTWNIRHFQLLGEPVRSLLKTPPLLAEVPE